LESFNPWWKNEEDIVIEKWKNATVKWFPEEILNISLKPFSLNFLSGPRQVGKTTAIKLLISKLLERESKEAIFYYSCDELIDFKELGEVLDTYLKSAPARSLKKRIIFLDEVTFVEDWWRALKLRIDSGKLRNDIITISGSASLQLLEERERFPGRRGYGKDVIMNPRSFTQYVEILSAVRPERAKSLDEVEKAIEGNAVYAETLSTLFGIYIKTGGFPRGIVDAKERGMVSEATIKSFLDSLRSDWARAGRSDRYMKELLAYILQARGAPISWLSVSRETSLASPHTAQVYVETLEKLLVANTLEFISPQGRIIHRKNRKIHFSDPLAYHAFASFARVKVDEPALVEGIVASHLARNSELYYWKNSSEVDAVVKQNGKLFGIETKWGFKKSHKPRHLSRFIILNKRTLPLFLSSLG
jgi:predicted AAA+ superfamily ATPase